LKLTLLEIQDLSELDFNNDEAETLNEKYAKYKIEIEDNGAGISEENIGKLFVDFGMLD
jgi:signal transduction histidine kinase